MERGRGGEGVSVTEGAGEKKGRGQGERGTLSIFTPLPVRSPALRSQSTWEKPFSRGILPRRVGGGGASASYVRVEVGWTGEGGRRFKKGGGGGASVPLFGVHVSIPLLSDSPAAGGHRPTR